MSASPVCAYDLATHPATAQAMLHPSPNLTRQNLSTGTASSSVRTASSDRESQLSSHPSADGLNPSSSSENSASSSSIKLIDLTTDEDEAAEIEEIDIISSDEEAVPHLALCNANLRHGFHLRTSDITDNNRSISNDSEASFISLNKTAEATLGVPALLDPTHDLPPHDNVFIPTRYRQKSMRLIGSSAIDLTSDSTESESETTTGSYTSVSTSTPATTSRTAAASPTNPHILAPTNSEDDADLGMPMPRILPKFEKKTFVDFVDLESSSEDDKEDREDILTKEDLNIWLQSQTGRYGSLLTCSPSRTYRPAPRNTTIEHPIHLLETYTHNGIILRPGVNVELQDKAVVQGLDQNGVGNERHSYFMRIINIIEDSRDQAVGLRGWVFHRAQYLNGVLEKKRNELCWVMHVDEDDDRDIKVQAMETVSVNHTVRRRKIRLTNQPWPKLSYREDTHILEDSEETIRNERVLVCRFMYICYYVCAERREANSWSERILQRLRHGDCDKWSGQQGESCALDDAELRTAWRGKTIPRGEFVLNGLEKPWSERLVDISRKNIVELTEKIVERDPDDGDQVLALQNIEQSCSITNISTRIDWTTSDGTEYCTISGFTPSKRRAETDPTFGSVKRSRKEQYALKTERPPETYSILKRKILVARDVPTEQWSQSLFSNKTGVQSSNDDRKLTPLQKRQYTFGDLFCGAGGMSRAAHQTGLHIKYAFDCNKHACSSYNMNFPNASLHCLWANDFIALDGDRKVDIAHLSPPCQFFSDAHTVAGKDDEMNTASLFAVGELLKKSRPRVVTLEQTFGIVLRARHQGYLNALVQVFTCHGFSIRWRLLHCADYGLPQMRLRTFMIASW